MQASQTSTQPQAAPRLARVGLCLGPAWILMTLLLPAPSGMSDSAWLCAGLGLLMATWWATEAIPIPATALLPLVLVPAFGISDMNTTASHYANPVIYLFLGGFLLGISMQRWNLHRRIALKVLQVVGHQPRRQIGGFMVATGFIGLWVSNTATAIMMLPIGMSVIALLENDNDPRELARYATALLLAIAYAASIGGLATLIGTPPNALLAGYLASNHGIDIGFFQWMLVGVPVSTTMMVIAWWWLTRKGFTLKVSDDSDKLIHDELDKMGKMSGPERRVTLVFVLAAGGWVMRPFINDLGLTWVTDATIAVCAGLILFLMPSGRGEGERLITWKDANELPWGILLLFGGGLALAGAISRSGLAEWIAGQFSMFGMLPTLALVGLVVLVIIFFTEITSNTATAAAFVPLLGAMAMSLDISPVLITVPATIAASCAFMMPVATPPNALVFSTGRVKIQSMIRAGFALSLFGTVVVTLLSYTLITALW